MRKKERNLEHVRVVHIKVAFYRGLQWIEYIHEKADLIDLEFI